MPPASGCLILPSWAPRLEIYSIDEAFLSCAGIKEEALEYYGRQIQSAVRQSTGIPVSVGIAPTKTLAKAANHFAKREEDKGGVLCLTTEGDIDHYLRKLPLEEVWGIGRRKAEFLKRNNIKDVLQLAQTPDSWIKKYLTVMTMRTVWELRGVVLMGSDPSNSLRNKGLNVNYQLSVNLLKINRMLGS